MSSIAQGNADDFHGRMDVAAPAAQPAAAPAAPAAPRNLVPQPWTEQSPDQGPKRNAQGHKERSASAERRIAERMVELEARLEANRKLRGPEHVWASGICLREVIQVATALRLRLQPGHSESLNMK